MNKTVLLKLKVDGDRENLFPYYSGVVSCFCKEPYFINHIKVVRVRKPGKLQRLQ